MAAVGATGGSTKLEAGALMAVPFYVRLRLIERDLWMRKHK
jgi:hypothetical protein